MFIRVRDKETGHEFDVAETSHLLTKGLVEPVKSDRHPISLVQRPAKYHTDLAGRPVPRQPKPSKAEAPADTSKEA